jgi:hypothetical protein
VQPTIKIRVNSAIRLRALVIRQQRHRHSGANRDHQIRKPVGQVLGERFWFDAHNTLAIEAHCNDTLVIFLVNAGEYLSGNISRLADESFSLTGFQTD